jgi:Holliday junction resolvasome RuvABC endonuclease subunit
MIVMGIDPGATVGLCVLNLAERPTSRVWSGSSRGETAAEVLGEIAIPALVCVERVERVHGSPRMGSAYAEGLVRAAWLGGEIAQWCRSRGARVVTCSAGTWRGALCGSSQATDAAIAAMVRLRIRDWPARSNAHERDAAGCALWAGLGLAAPPTRIELPAPPREPLARRARKVTP